MDFKGIEKKFYDICHPVISSHELCLYDLEYLSVQKLLRIYIYQAATKTAQLEDCVKIDKALSPAFEETEWIPEEITLEVSSPGIFRDLRTLEHYQMAVGERIKAKIMASSLTVEQKQLLQKKLHGGYLIGKILSLDNGAIQLECDDRTLVSLELDKITKANLEPLLENN